MPLEDVVIAEFMGETRSSLIAIRESLEKQGARIGALEEKFNTHLATANNSRRQKIVYGFSGGSLVGVLELLRHLLK